MSLIAQSALAAAAIVAASSVLLPAASPATDLEIYQEEFRALRASALPRQDRLPFDYQVRHVFNQRFGATRYEPEDERHLISRRYCKADAALSDGHTRDIWCLIEGRTGFAGIGDNVESASSPALIARSMTVVAVSSRETPKADQFLNE